jgi:hypothetical protein
MSWISQNYEKAAVGGGLVIAAGLVFCGWSKLGGVEDDFSVSLKGAGGKETGVQGADLVSLAQSSLVQKHAWAQGDADGRPVDLFTSVPLFVQKEAPTKPVDLLKDAPIHPPIPNTWWLEHRIDPGYADSPKRDPDADGFSNEEEFAAKTDPNNPKAHPQLVSKLSFVRDDSVQWLLEPGFSSNGGFTFRYYDTKGQTNKAGALDIVKPGELFFKQGAAKERFKMLGSEERSEENPNTHAMEVRTYVKIEDQRPNKKGKIYEIPNNIPDARKPNYNQFDRTAVLTLEALGQGGKEFKIEENTRFALPVDSADKKYLLKKVTPEAIEVEYTDAAGGVKTLELRKGAGPQQAP